MALVYGLYYGLRHGRYDTLWMFGVLFVFFYLAFLLWQTYYAILTARNASWGTRRRAAAEAADVTLAGEALRGAVAFLLLPLSLVPLYFAVPKIRSERGRREPDRAALRRPALHAERREARALARRCPVPRRGAGAGLPRHQRRARPLLDHPRAFAEQMAMLERAGFETIRIAQYVRFLQGDSGGCRERPILITFDDGRLDSYRGADQMLAEHGFRATMFVIAGRRGRQHLLPELGRAAPDGASGRWDLQEHAGAGTTTCATTRPGTGPRLRLPPVRPGGGLESFAEYRRRVTEDILWAKRTMSEQLPGFSPVELRRAVRRLRPGGRTTRASRASSRLPAPPLPGGVPHRAAGVHDTVDVARGAGPHRAPQDTGTDKLYRWLRDRIPSRRAASGGPVAQPAVEQRSRACTTCPAWRRLAAAQVQRAADRLELLGERDALARRRLERARRHGASLALVQVRTRFAGARRSSRSPTRGRRAGERCAGPPARHA